MAAAGVSIEEIIRASGLSKTLFNLRNAEAFEAMIAERLIVQRVRLKRAVGDTVWGTTDADKQIQLKEILTKAVTVDILDTVLNQRITGTGAALIMARPDLIQARIDRLTDEVNLLADDVQIDAPSREAQLLSEAVTTSTSADPWFTRDQQF